VDSFHNEDDYEDYHAFMLQQQHEYDEWLESQDFVDYVNITIAEVLSENETV
jgi:hypothetical protein